MNTLRFYFMSQEVVSEFFCRAVLWVDILFFGGVVFGVVCGGGFLWLVCLVFFPSPRCNFVSG